MRNDSVQQYVRLHRALVEEKSSLEKRLQLIDQALGEIEATAPTASPASFPAPATKPGARPPLSAAARARIAEAQRARWAKQKGETTSPARQKSAGKARRLARKIGNAARVPHT